MTTKEATIRFLDFLKGLAPEGETPLIVRQKPQLDKNGELQFHPNKAIKATWPAALPDIRRIKDGQAWYGNTGCYIIDRFKDGKVSASAANCEYCMVLVLDDVGTKSKTPPLPPTWVMETSEGNYQWGYAFADGQEPTKGEFAAAVTAIAEAGYTDPGMINPVRNFRLPGSVNLKPDRNGFISRLVEFHPEREYSLTEICVALGVTPGEADGGGIRPIRVHDTGADDVFAWLADKGLVLSRPNAEGWAGIVCPNNAEHTDGNPEGRYMPATRAYCCMHGHCIDFDTKTFLAWVADNGGPKHEPGFRDDLIASTMQTALAQLEPGQMFTDDAAAVIREVELRELGRLDKAKWFERFAYVIADDAYFDLETRRDLSRRAFNALYRHVDCKSIHGARRVEASIAFDENRQAMGARAIVGLTYAAGESVLVSHDGDVHGNRWRDARPPVVLTAPAPDRWLDHVEHLLPDADERRHVLDVMAFKLQNPRVKINHAVLHGGSMGGGKDTMWMPFLRAIGGPGLVNVGQLESHQLFQPWGYHLEKEVLMIHELRQPESSDRRALENKLKPMLAAPPEFLTVERKNAHPYLVLNRILVVAQTNQRDAIAIGSDDRRWFVVWSDVPKMTRAEGASFWAWLHGGGFDSVAAWLYRRDVSQFSPGATPPMTDAKMAMIGSARSMGESWLIDQIEARSGEFARGVVGAPWQALCDRLQGTAPTGTRLVPAALLHALREAGWTDLGLCHSAARKTKKHLWTAPWWAGTKAEAREAVEVLSNTGVVRLVK